MCGLFGVRAPERDVARVTYFGLFALQHRGQESAGIAVSDEGRLTAHRIFFGLPRRSVELAAAARPEATVTELAYMADQLTDGAYLVELQAPALGGDAVPSRPLLYRISERVS